MMSIRLNSRHDDFFGGRACSSARFYFWFRFRCC
jgi:hypothetical protein